MRGRVGPAERGGAARSGRAQQGRCWDRASASPGCTAAEAVAAGSRNARAGTTSPAAPEHRSEAEGCPVTRGARRHSRVSAAAPNFTLGCFVLGKKEKKKNRFEKNYLFSWRNPCRLELRPAAHPRPAECRRPQRALRPRPQRLQRSLPRAKPVPPAPPRPAAQPALRVLCEGPLRCSLPLQQTAGVKCSEVPQFSVNVGSGGVRLR